MKKKATFSAYFFLILVTINSIGVLVDLFTRVSVVFWFVYFSMRISLHLPVFLRWQMISMSTFCIVITTDVSLSLIVINSRCVYFSGCYGDFMYYRSQCFVTGWTRLQFWVWCPTCGFKLIARWYPQRCSCYRWGPNDPVWWLWSIYNRNVSFQ